MNKVHITIAAANKDLKHFSGIVRSTEFDAEDDFAKAKDGKKHNPRDFVCRYHGKEIKTVYLSGQISGNSHYYLFFNAAEQALRMEKLDVINPADLPEGLTERAYMRFAFASVEAVDAVCLLPSWKDSAGAKIEKAYAEYINKPVFPLKDIVSQRNLDFVAREFGFIW